MVHCEGTIHLTEGALSTQPQHSHSWRGRTLRVEIPFTRAGVAHHVWVGNDDRSLLFDAGDGVLRDLLTLDIQPMGLEAIFITHGHYDHMGGLHSLFGFMRMIGRSKSLPVYVPEGCLEAKLACENFKSCYPDDTPFEIEVVEMSPGQQVDVGGMSVESYPMIHCGSIAGGEILDPIPAFGYRVVLEEESVAISGDTGDCPGLRKLVSGADLALIEATFASSEGRDRRVLERVHLSEDIAGEIGLAAREVILVHKGRRA